MFICGAAAAVSACTACTSSKARTLAERYPLDCDALTFLCQDKAYGFTQSDVIPGLCGAACFEDWQKLETQTEMGAEVEILIDLHNGTAFALIPDTSYIKIGTRLNTDAAAGSWDLENAGGCCIARRH